MEIKKNQLVVGFKVEISSGKIFLPIPVCAECAGKNLEIMYRVNPL
jgi:hypothetical protein